MTKTRQMENLNWCISKNVHRKAFLQFIAMAVFAGFGILLNSCGDSNDPIDEEKGLKITGVSIPASLNIEAEGDFILTGKGFALGDQIRLTSSTDASKEYSSSIKFVTDQTATFVLPGDLASGNYKVSVVRGSESLHLGSLLLNIVTDTSIPDIAGMTVKGVVYCDGEGVPGVVVSDGYEVTVTDNEGIYYLPSQKKSGYVFISVPGNYEVSNDKNVPQFFKRLSGGSAVEQKDFSLIRVDNSKHVIIAMADWHLANRNDDLSQFASGFLADVNATISSYQAAGAKVYGLTLGDMSWDVYWYDNNFALNQYLTQMNKIDCTIFNVMGNHDNDPYFGGNWLAEATYKDIICPTYYSFNLGDVHYVVLDNVEYINTGGSQGVIGSRNYNDIIVADQMAWLQKDLATVTDKSTPIVIGMHTPLHRTPTLDAIGNQVDGIALNNGTALIDLLKDFSNVRVLSGHYHVNYTVEPKESLMEYNTGAVCATWWWTGKNGYAGNHICKDGSPGGYGVWEMNNTDSKYHYKSIGYEKNYQFRSYDLNSIYITAASFAPNSTDEKLAPYAGSYANPNTSNEVLINIWGYDNQWKIEVTENNQLLEVTRVSAKDPLHIISYEAKRLNVGATPTDSFITGVTSHMFKVKATSPTSTLNITVTDRFGNVFTESMSRPKAFAYSMK